MAEVSDRLKVLERTIANRKQKQGLISWTPDRSARNAPNWGHFGGITTDGETHHHYRDRLTPCHTPQAWGMPTAGDSANIRPEFGQIRTTPVSTGFKAVPPP